MTKQIPVTIDSGLVPEKTVNTEARERQVVINKVIRQQAGKIMSFIRQKVAKKTATDTIENVPTITRSSLYRLEKGDSDISIDTIVALLHYYQVRPDLLLLPLFKFYSYLNDTPDLSNEQIAKARLGDELTHLIEKYHTVEEALSALNLMMELSDVSHSS